MADPITAEQVARAIEAARSDEGGISDALGGWQWDKRAPDYVRVAWGKPSLPDFIAALTRWRDELVEAERLDDTAPERLRERREALGWSRRDMANMVLYRSVCMDNVPEYANCWHPEDVRRCEEVPDAPAVYAQHRARYAAALSAEEERLGAQLLADEEARAEAFHSVPERPAPRFKVGDWARDRDTVFRVAEMHWDDDRWYARPVAGVRDGIAEYSLQPASPPAPEVVDVPQPIAKRVSGVMVDGRDEDQYALWVRGESVIALTFVRNDSADSHESVSIPLLRAMLDAIDAQQPVPVQPTRPEPRYKVGDWVRVVTGPNSTGRINPIRVTCVTSAGYIMADGASWAAEHLTPALDPALHETARKTVAWLRGGARGTGPADFTTLPGWSDWNSGSRWDAAEHWAAQLERLLGGAS